MNLGHVMPLSKCRSGPSEPGPREPCPCDVCPCDVGPRDGQSVQCTVVLCTMYCVLCVLVSPAPVLNNNFLLELLFI